MFITSLILLSDKVANFPRALTAYRSLIPDFDGFLNQLPTAEQQALRATYNL